MRMQPTSELTGQIIVLSISPHEEDHQYLHAIIGQSRWKVFTARDLATARSLLQEHEISVVICERDLVAGTWIDVLENINTLPNAPSLIVASRLADDRLWAEAVNLGVWDVLAKPFNRIGLIRSVHSAWRRWYDHLQMSAKAVTVVSAAS